MLEEQKIRNYLLNLSKNEKADSVYLFRLDFKETPLETILSSIVNLYEEVNNLKNIIEERFEHEDRTLTKEEAVKQAEIIKDYGRKSVVLEKILCNDLIYDYVIEGIVTIEQDKQSKNL